MTEENEVLEFHEENSLSPGSRLRIARERFQLGIEDIAHKMRLKPSIIQIIENDDYENIHRGAVFIRGYLRGYAKLVDISGDEVVQVFDKMYQEEPVDQPALKGRADRVSSKDRPIRWITFVIFSGLVVLVGLWWHNQKNNYVKVPLRNSEQVQLKTEKGIPHSAEQMDATKPINVKKKRVSNKPQAIHKYSRDLDF